jgi:hypothetical protein
MFLINSCFFCKMVQPGVTKRGTCITPWGLCVAAKGWASAGPSHKFPSRRAFDETGYMVPNFGNFGEYDKNGATDRNIIGNGKVGLNVSKANGSRHT